MTASQLLYELLAAHERLARMAKPLIPSRPETDPDVQLAMLIRETMRHAEFWRWVESDHSGMFVFLIGDYNQEQLRKGMGREDGRGADAGEERCG